MTTLFSINFFWKGQLRQCTLYRCNGKRLSLFFDDQEIDNVMGDIVDLYKVDGRLVLPHNIADENMEPAIEIFSSIEEALKKPLLWLFA